jgi:eukaryotic-like serine/threonine-protein kinase
MIVKTVSVLDSRLIICDRYRFDPFEVRVHAGVLLRGNIRIRIQELPFRMLVVLLENRGQVVSAEELGRRLWGRETHVELGSSLRVAAAKLREALDDKAREPVFIKTVSGQGYKFIGAAVPIPESAVEAVAVPEESPIAQPGNYAPKPLVLQNLIKAVVFVIVALGLAVLAVFLYGRLERPLASGEDQVVVGGFTNRSGDPAFDGILSSAFRVELEESPYLSLIPDQRFIHLVKDPDSASLQTQLDACRAVQGKILLEGLVTAAAQRYQVEATAWRCADGKLLTSQKASADSKIALLPALDTIVDRLRRRMGEKDDSIHRFNVPAAHATTASLSALKAFALGEENRDRGAISDAISDYKIAVDLDSQFALAYARLGTIYFNLGELTQSRQNYQRAFDLRDRATDRDRLYITSHYYAFATGEIRRAIEAYQVWRTVYPRDMSPANNLAVEYSILGQPEESVKMAKTAIRLDPLSAGPYDVLGKAYLMSGDYVNLRELCNARLHAQSDASPLHLYCFQGASAQGDEAGMQRVLQWAHGSLQESFLINVEAMISMRHGRVTKGRRFFADAKRNAIASGLTEVAAEISSNESLIEADIGLAHEAREDALDAVRLAPNNVYVHAFAALVFGRTGDLARAQVEADYAAAQSPLDTILNSAVLASVHAAVQLARHNPQAAEQALAEARPFDFNIFMSLAPAYYRGLAFLEEKQPVKAAREFQRVLDHRVIEPDSSYISLAQLELGRALQMAGKMNDARVAYQEAQATWKSADPDFLPSQEARMYQDRLPK